MTDGPTPTIEDLQNELVTLKEQLETSNAKIQELNESKTKLESDLSNARSVNAKLMKNLPTGEETIEEKEEKETPEQFLDSFIEPAIKKLGKR